MRLDCESLVEVLPDLHARGGAGPCHRSQACGCVCTCQATKHGSCANFSFSAIFLSRAPETGNFSILPGRAATKRKSQALRFERS